MPMKRLLAAVVIVVAGVTVWTLTARERNEALPLPTDLDSELTSEEVRADLEYLAATLAAVHPSGVDSQFFESLGAQLEEMVESEASSWTRRGFYRELAPLVAKLNDGHTNLKLPVSEINHRAQQGAKWFPLEVAFSGDRIIVTSNYSDDSTIAPGSELLTINGVDATEIGQEMIRFVSSKSLDHRRTMVASYFNFYLWIVYGFEGSFEITMRERGTGEIASHAVDGSSYGSIVRGRANARNLPLDSPFKYESLPAEGLGVLTVDQFIEQDRFKSVLREMLSEFKKNEIAHLVVDLRRNGGGSTRVSDELLRLIADKPVRNYAKYDLRVSPQIKVQLKRQVPSAIRWLPVQYLFATGRAVWGGEEGTTISIPGEFVEPKGRDQRFTGQLYVLIGPATFSTAADFAAVVKDFELGILIGEETGGRACSLGDTYLFRLPHSRFEVGVSWKSFIRPSGEVTDGGVLPDHTAPRTPYDTVDGRDAAMDLVLKLAAGRERAVVPVGEL